MNENASDASNSSSDRGIGDHPAGIVSQIGDGNAPTSFCRDRALRQIDTPAHGDTVNTCKESNDKKHAQVQLCFDIREYVEEPGPSEMIGDHIQRQQDDQYGSSLNLKAPVRDRLMAELFYLLSDP